MNFKHILFDWGDTLMEDIPGQEGPMCQWPEIIVVEGAAICLAELSKYIKCHVATNAIDSNEIEIRKAFERVGLSKYISEIFCFKRIGYKKPSEEYFNYVIQKLGVQKGDICVVGDSLVNDVFGAMNFGISAIWFNRLGEDAPSGVKTIRNLIELNRA